MRQLCDGCGLARPVDPDHQDDLRPRERLQFPSGLATGARISVNLVSDNLARRPARSMPLSKRELALSVSRICAAVRRPKIGNDQRLLNRIEHVGIELALW